MLNFCKMRDDAELSMERCPHCGVALPRLTKLSSDTTEAHDQTNRARWSTYVCRTCGGVVLTCTYAGESEVCEIWPELKAVSDAIPERAAEYLRQAISSVHTAAGCVMLTASAVDSMLKAKGLTEGTLNTRIDKAADTHLITPEMADWAHEVRLDANDQRHADDSAPLPTKEDAERAIDFAQALAEFLFVLPARVKRGRKTEPHETAQPQTQGPKFPPR